MRKLFFAICFSLLPLSWVQAKVTEVMTQQDIPQKQVSQQTTPETKVITKEDLSDFLEERIRAVKIIDKKDVDQRATDTQPSDEFFIKNSDYCINNGSSKDEMTDQLYSIFEQEGIYLK